MTGCCGYVCGPLCASVYLDVGVVVALLSSLESVLIKKKWVLLFARGEVAALQTRSEAKQSAGGNKVWLETSNVPVCANSLELHSA